METNSAKLKMADLEQVIRFHRAAHSFFGENNCCAY